MEIEAFLVSAVPSSYEEAQRLAVGRAKGRLGDDFTMSGAGFGNVIAYYSGGRFVAWHSVGLGPGETGQFQFSVSQ